LADSFTTVLVVPKAPEHAPEIEKLFEELGNAAAQEGIDGRTHAYFKGDDGSYRIIERYPSVAARQKHVETLNFDKVRRLAELAEFRDLEILGETSEELKAVAAASSPTYRRYLTGVL
jgi:hypothetical protein